MAFVETEFTVDESVGAVNMCVNLTQPELDIVDETVNVFVIDDSSSVYIPAGAPLASKPSECIAVWQQYYYHSQPLILLTFSVGIR